MSDNSAAVPSPRRPWLRVGILLTLFLAIAALAPFLGYSDLNYSEVFNRSIPRAENPEATIFFDLRLSRVLFAALVGAALSTAGAVFQVALRNELATPYTLGVSGAASLGALLAIKAGLTGFATAVGGLTGGLCAVLFILGLARVLRAREGTVTLLLAGVTLNLLFGSVVLVLQYLSDPYETFHMVRWMMGGVDVFGMGISAKLGAPVVLVLLFLWANGQPLNLLALDDATARSLGENPDRRRLLVIGGGALLAALAVSFAGPIGFIGLIIPHAVRRIVGMDNRFVLPGSALAGAGFLILADTVGRIIGGASEIPVGVITTLIGGPVFLIILFRRQIG